jgi:hypothetical protein
MLAKLYFYSWLLTGVAFLLFTVAGSMTMFALVVFGFIAFGMVFMGMISVLPSTVAHPQTGKVVARPEKVSPKPVVSTIQHGAHTLRA